MWPPMTCRVCRHTPSMSPISWLPLTEPDPLCARGTTALRRFVWCLLRTRVPKQACRSYWLAEFAWLPRPTRCVWPIACGNGRSAPGPRGIDSGRCIHVDGRSHCWRASCSSSRSPGEGSAGAMAMGVFYQPGSAASPASSTCRCLRSVPRSAATSAAARRSFTIAGNGGRCSVGRTRTRYAFGCGRERGDASAPCATRHVGPWCARP